MRQERPGRFSVLADRRIFVFSAAAVLLILLLGAVFFYNNCRLRADPVRFYERMVARSPGSTRLRVGLAQAYLDQERLKEAEALLIDVLKKDPQGAAAYNVLGSVYYRMNRKADAEATWHNGLSSDASFPGLYTNLGALEAEKGDLGEALFFFKEAAKRDPTSPDPYKNAALACYNAGQYHEALSYWERAQELGMREDPLLAGMMEKARRQIAVTDM